MSTQTTTKNTYNTAPLWRRLAALGYDTFILLALSFGYGALLTGISAAMSDSIERDYQPMFDNVFFFIGWLLTLISFYAWFWWRGGQTIGMKTWRIQLIKAQSTPNNSRPDLSSIALRIITGVPSFWLLGAGYWYRLSNTNGDCLHDVISRTRVVTVPKIK